MKQIGVSKIVSKNDLMKGNYLVEVQQNGIKKPLSSANMGNLNFFAGAE